MQCYPPKANNLYCIAAPPLQLHRKIHSLSHRQLSLQGALKMTGQIRPSETTRWWWINWDAIMSNECVCRSAKVQAQVAAHTNHPFRARVQEWCRKPCPPGEQAESVSTRPTESATHAQHTEHRGFLTPPVPKAGVIRTLLDSWVTNVIIMSESSGTWDQAVLTCCALTAQI